MSDGRNCFWSIKYIAYIFVFQLVSTLTLTPRRINSIHVLFFCILFWNGARNECIKCGITFGEYRKLYIFVVEMMFCVDVLIC